MTEIVTGDDVDLVLDLQNADGTSIDLSGASSVQVALISLDRATTLAGPFAASSSYAGAAWATGRVVVPVPGTDTAALTVTRCEIEVQAMLAGGARRTWPRCLAGGVIITKGRIP
jgi:hypothetical protein